MKILYSFILIIGFISFGNKANEIKSIQANQIQFWNHAAASPDEYKGLSKSGAMYDPAISFMEDGTSVKITFIKKLSNWHQQHSNGLKINFNNPVLTFGDLEALIFSLSLNKPASIIPSKKELYQRYHKNIVSGLVQKSWLNELFSEYGFVNIKLFGEYHDDQNIETVFANYQLKLSPSQLNHYKKSAISTSMFDFYRQKNWQEQTVLLDEIKAIKVLGMLITAETANEKTLRSYLQDSYSTHVHENYIELVVSMKDIALITRDKKKQYSVK